MIKAVTGAPHVAAPNPAVLGATDANADDTTIGIRFRQD